MPDVAVKKKRPLWYDLNLLHLPLPGIASILHRVSGALLFLLAFGLLYLLDASLESAETFARVRQVIAHPFAKLVLLGLLWAFLHHFFMGVRCLFLDIDVGTDLPTARATSVAVVVLSLLLTGILGAALLW
jgi:succinate dehydrogenase / fumarate reductase cytochrome b subunit